MNRKIRKALLTWTAAGFPAGNLRERYCRLVFSHVTRKTLRLSRTVSFVCRNTFTLSNGEVYQNR